MFPSLPPAAQPSEALTDAIADLGRPGGLLDAKDPLERGPIDLIVDLSLSAGNPQQPEPSGGDDIPARPGPWNVPGAQRLRPDRPLLVSA